ncbi:hypothetical protein VpasPP24_42 [Vibrio phage Vpas_PP24]|nr:hypothetical protein VpasPP24_42 [Vibrio phage Vpas_PP24]
MSLDRSKTIIETLSGKVDLIVLSSLTGKPYQTIYTYCKKHDLPIKKVTRRDYNRERRIATRVSLSRCPKNKELQRRKAVIRALAGKVPCYVLSSLTGLSKGAVTYHARNLGLSVCYIPKRPEDKLERNKYTHDQISRVKELINDKVPYSKIYEATGVSSGVVSAIRHDKIHREVKPAIVKPKSQKQISIELNSVFN